MQRFSETLKGDKMRGRELHVLQGHCYLSHQLDSSRWIAISDQDFFGKLMQHKVSSTFAWPRPHLPGRVTVWWRPPPDSKRRHACLGRFHMASERSAGEVSEESGCQKHIPCR